MIAPELDTTPTDRLTEAETKVRERLVELLFEQPWNLPPEHGAATRAAEAFADLILNSDWLADYVRAKVATGLALAAQIEAEALHSYRKPPDQLDPIITVRRIRHALGLTQ